jgi:soluble lytic murein transglycosylase-like protein
MLRQIRCALIVACLAYAGPLGAREMVCLTSGFCLAADSHTQTGQTLILRSGTGTTEFPADQVAQISEIGTVPEQAGTPSNPVQVKLEPQLAPDDLLRRAAVEQGLEPEFVRSVARVESGLHQNAVSVKGALGLMQLMPGTATAMGVDAKLADQNAQGGARILRALLLRYRYDPVLALAAYNAGEGAVQKFGGVPPYLETRRYVVKVLREYAREQKAETKAKTTNLGSATNKPNATN